MTETSLQARKFSLNVPIYVNLMATKTPSKTLQQLVDSPSSTPAAGQTVNKTTTSPLKMALSRGSKGSGKKSFLAQALKLRKKATKKPISIQSLRKNRTNALLSSNRVSRASTNTVDETKWKEEYTVGNGKVMSIFNDVDGQ